MTDPHTQFATHQAGLANAFQGGAPGVAVSGLVWLAAALATAQAGIANGFTVLFLGGMAIFPLSLLIARFGFKAPPVAAGNPLERVALESTFGLFAGIVAGYLVLSVAPHLSFAIVAVAVGARYFLFRSLYADPLYWVLGAAMAGVGLLVAFTGLMAGYAVPFAIGVIEVVMAMLIFVRWRRTRT